MERQQLLERESFWAGKAICASADTKVHITTKSRKKIKNTEDTIQKNVLICSLKKAIGLTKSQP
jgi:hypothetical protein